MAARTYSDGKFYADALRCFRQVGDKQGRARVYEKMKEFDKALTIWIELGKTKEVTGVMKKKAKNTSKE
ncbi:MAG: hypothetical protein SV775_01615 [Thermodesulfobacteriota bacterium]|nr:hypothetical protein [Thermodesulfobacteriota bacterium]